MNELFSHILQRHRGTVPMVKPRPPSRFETARSAFTPPAAPSLREEPGETRPFTTKTLQNPPPASYPRLRSSAVAPKPQPGLAAPETAASRDALRLQLSRQIDEGEQPQVRLEDNTLLQPAQRTVETSRHFSTSIARNTAQPHGHQAQSIATDNKLQGMISSPFLPVTTQPVLAPPTAEPIEFQPPPQRQERMVDTVRPVATMVPTRNTQPAPSPTSLSPKTSTEWYSAIIDHASLSPVAEDGSRLKEYLLVPPDWLARIQFDFQRGRDSTGPDSKAEPTINVTIGRVEVRAEASPVPTKPRAKDKAGPVMSLDEYLSQRKGRG